MFTNKLNPNGGGKKMYTQTKEKKRTTHYTIFAWRKKTKTFESMNIALIVHFTPQTLRKARGGGYVVSSSEMVGGKKYKNVCVYIEQTSQEGYKPWNRHLRAEREKRVGCVVTFCRHSEKTGSSFQTPVQAIEWVSSVKESDTESSWVCFKYSIARKSPHAPNLLLSCLFLL